MEQFFNTKEETEIKDERQYIYILEEEGIWVKVWLEDIYYIETIKSTHFCEIVYKNGKGRLRADITPLYQRLSHYLYKVKASTLVNLNQVQKVDTKNRLLYFQNHIYCSYAQRTAREIKEILNIQSYRRNGGKRHGQVTDVSF